MMRGSHLLSLHGRKGHWLLYIQLSSMLTGCLSIEAVHDPLYRASPHTSTISASASASWGRSIKRITITVTEGRADYCRMSNGIAPGAIPCRKNASAVIHTCEFPDSPTSALCKYELATHPLPPPTDFIRSPTEPESHRIRAQYEPRLVTYSAMVESRSAFGVSYDFADEITYAAGDYPPDLARPMWWHKDKTLDSKIDIALFPNDTDYLNYDFFLADVNTVIKGAFFSAGKTVSNMYSDNRKFVNLWAAPFGAFSDGCHGFDPWVRYRTLDIENTLAPLVAIMDGKTLIHRGRFTDCADIVYGRGLGTTDVATDNSGKTGAGYDPVWLFIHESWHYIHGMGDEYPGGGNIARNPCANVFQSKSDCESVRSARGMDTNTSCDKITDEVTTVNVWHRVTPGPLDDLMDKNHPDVDWLTDCRYCLRETFTNCESGQCF